MLTVIGGTYQEVCLHPRWNELYGSGIRAAAATSEIAKAQNDTTVTLVTWANKAVQSTVKAIGDTYGFKTELRDRHTPIEFQYDHALGPPRLLFQESSAEISLQGERLVASNALVFGMVETTPMVNATSLVYDPQAGKRAVPPSHLHHSFERLAIVANKTEAAAMLRASVQRGHDVPKRTKDVAKALLLQEGCEAVVVKNGTRGAIVATKNSTDTIPGYITDRVFPIGSGDVFSGIFAIGWTELSLDARGAADLASAATAFYCQSGVLPIPTDVMNLIGALKRAPVEDDMEPALPLRIYLAGPLFTMPQLWLLNEAKRCLEEQGLKVFSPKDEVGFLPNLQSAESVAHADIKGLAESDLVFAILDGFDPGTVFEVGYACHRNIPVVAFAESPDPAHLTMFVGTGCQVFGEFPTAIYHACWKARKREKGTPPIRRS